MELQKTPSMEKWGRLSVSMAVAAAVVSAVWADTMSGTAEDVIPVDVRQGPVRAVGSVDVGYSPVWGGVTNAGAYVRLQKVVNGVTNTVATFDAEAASICSYTPDGGDGNFVRLIHRVFSSGGEEIGEPLVRDVVFGFSSVSEAGISADSRTNSLQLAVDERRSVALAYSTAWATNAAAVSIGAVRLSGQGGTPTATNVMFTASADAEGYAMMGCMGKGWWRLLCRSTDGKGGTLLEYLTAEFKMPGGIVIYFR